MTTPVLDPAALERLSQWGGPQLLAQMVRLFLENAPVRLEQIRKGLEEGSLRDAERGAHSLKSSAANVGAVEVNGLAREMEDRAVQEDLAAVAELEPPLRSALERAMERLEAELQEIEG